MPCHLVLAGSHSEYLRWLSTRPVQHSRTPFRSIHAPSALYVIPPHDVDSFHRVGSYWTNPVFGSEEYREFMAAGVRLGAAWALPWPDDWHQAMALRSAAGGPSAGGAQRTTMGP
jgi:hypothetical protein